MDVEANVILACVYEANGVKCERNMCQFMGRRVYVCVRELSLKRMKWKLA